MDNDKKLSEIRTRNNTQYLDYYSALCPQIVIDILFLFGHIDELEQGNNKLRDLLAESINWNQEKENNKLAENQETKQDAIEKYLILLKENNKLQEKLGERVNAFKYEALKEHYDNSIDENNKLKDKLIKDKKTIGWAIYGLEQDVKKYPAMSGYLGEHIKELEDKLAELEKN